MNLFKSSSALSVIKAAVIARIAEKPIIPIGVVAMTAYAVTTNKDASFVAAIFSPEMIASFQLPVRKPFTTPFTKAPQAIASPTTPNILLNFCNCAAIVALSNDSRAFAIVSVSHAEFFVKVTFIFIICSYRF